jgi:hypothetical protein
MHLHSCNSSWISEAGTTGAGIGADISFAPTEKTRVLGRFVGDSIWAELQGCAPFPYLTNGEYQSVYQQFICHLEGGIVASSPAGGTGPTYDFEAWRPVVPAHDALPRCNPGLSSGAGAQYKGTIIQWAADPNSQKTAWLIQETNNILQRRWIPSSQIYFCLKNRGVGGPVALDHDFIAEYLSQRGSDVSQAEACGAAPAPTSPPSPPLTWAEQETPNHPVNTFLNYHNASGMGPPIAAGQWVQVSCKVYDPYIASVNPDGYWYRIASSPWNNSYYSPANTFMNGDPYGGPYTHNTDFAVPNC